MIAAEKIDNVYKDATPIASVEQYTASAQEFARLLDSTDELIWSVDMNFRTVTMNNAVREAMLVRHGVLPERGYTALEAMPEEEAQRWIGYYRKAIEDGDFIADLPTGASGLYYQVRFHRIYEAGRIIGIAAFARNVTELKKTEIAWQAAELRFNQVFDEALEGMYETETDGTVIAFNLAAVRMLGYDSREDLLSHIQNTATGLWVDAEKRAALLARLQESHAVHGMECQFRHKSGRTIDVLLTVRMVLDKEGKTHHLEGFCEDITQRKETEKKLLDSEERYRTSFEQAAVGIVHTSFQGEFLRCNARFAQIVGYTAEELVGMNFRNITPEDELQRGFEILEEIRTGKRESASFEKQYIRKDGTLTWVSLSSALLRDSAGKPLHLVATILDINDRRIAEEKLIETQAELRKKEERFRATFEQAAIGFLHTSLDGHILRCNEQFARIVGYEPQELIGISFQQITCPEDQPLGAGLLCQLLTGTLESTCLEKRYVRKDGTLVWVALTVSVQHDGEGRPVHFITTVQNIQDRKEAEEKLSQALDARQVSEERYHAAFQTMLDAMSINRMSDGVYLEVNPAFVEISGYSEAELIGRSSLELSVWANSADRARMVDLIRATSRCQNLEVQFRRKNGEIFWGLMSGALITLQGVPCVLTVTRDVSDARMAADEIRTLAFYDPLTGLPNRRLLLERLHQALASSTRQPQRRALFFVDLDDFKLLNDSLGHQTGDLLLQEVARRMTACTRATDTVARLGGDEFVVMLEGFSADSDVAVTQARQVAEKILATFSDPFLLDGLECRSTCSIGITFFGECREETNEVLQQADIAMYQAKAAGRNTMHFFAPSLQEAVTARVALEKDLREAIQQQQFVLYYQTQIARGRIHGAEALLRWQHPQRGLLGPGEFIRQAEESGLILSLGKWVLQEACRRIARWNGARQSRQIVVAVNISARQFRQHNFVDQVLDALKQAGADPHLLKLELTESMLIENVEDVIRKMTALKQHGLRFSLDDFGTGYSSLAYLQRLPLDQLKIDRSFVQRLCDDSANSAIVQAIISMGKAMHLSVIAEGVETEAQYTLLSHLGCHMFQGYLFGKPVPADKINFEQQFRGALPKQ